MEGQIRVISRNMEVQETSDSDPDQGKLQNYLAFCTHPDVHGFKGHIRIYTVDVIVTSECIHLYFLCIVPRCLFREVFVMYLSHVMPRCSYREIQ